jgi:hypothetical protein
MGGIEGERFCAERDEFAGELIAGDEADFAFGRGGVCGGGELEKAHCAGLEVKGFRHGGVLPADAFGGVDATKFAGKNSAFEECGKGAFR